MKRWILKVVALASVLALIAAPALAAQQTRSQDGSCFDGVADQTQERLRDCDQTRDCDQAQDCDQTQTQTQAGEATQAQVKAGEAAQTQVKAQVQAGEPIRAQVQTQTNAGEAAMTQAQAQIRSQGGEGESAHTPEWVQKMARLKKQFAKRAHIIVSSD